MQATKAPEPSVKETTVVNSISHISEIKLYCMLLLDIRPDKDQPMLLS